MSLNRRGVPRGGVIAPLVERVFAKLEPEPNSGCWLWLGARSPEGYGNVYVNAVRRPRRAHRVVYEIMRGSNPPGTQLDHKCRNTTCVNPGHLEIVSNRENTKRAFALRAACPSGHAYDAKNTYTDKNGHRNCRACHRLNEGIRRAVQPR